MEDLYHALLEIDGMCNFSDRRECSKRYRASKLVEEFDRHFPLELSIVLLAAKRDATGLAL
jgi:hypothetical protein